MNSRRRRQAFPRHRRYTRESYAGAPEIRRRQHFGTGCAKRFAPDVVFLRESSRTPAPPQLPEAPIDLDGQPREGVSLPHSPTYQYLRRHPDLRRSRARRAYPSEVRPDCRFQKRTRHRQNAPAYARSSDTGHRDRREMGYLRTGWADDTVWAAPAFSAAGTVATPDRSDFPDYPGSGNWACR